MGKTRIIAETGAGQHGVATASACALFGLPCEIYMGAVDVQRQALNVFRMRLLGAQVHAVKDGTATLKDAMNEALRDWVTNVRTTHYVIGSVAGPHPYPTLVRDFQAIIGREAASRSSRHRAPARRLRRPAWAAARTPWASTTPSSPTRPVRSTASRRPAMASTPNATPPPSARGASACCTAPVVRAVRRRGPDRRGPLHLRRPRLPRGRPEHSHLRDTGRARYVAVTDSERLDAFQQLARTEGILPALESSHAIAALPRVAAELDDGAVVLVSLSGRGDKDMGTIAKALGVELPT
jgi:tryptophan synthase beta chain